MQSIKIGDVVLIHDDGPRVHWKLVVIDKLSKGGDGPIHSADIRTSSGKTNRPIANLYLLEVTDDSMTPTQNRGTEELNSTCTHNDRPPRCAATNKATRQMTEWTKILVALPEDVEN